MAKQTKPQKITIAEYNDMMMEQAFQMLTEAQKQLREAKEKCNAAQRSIEEAAVMIVKARVDE